MGGVRTAADMEAARTRVLSGAERLEVTCQLRWHAGVAVAHCWVRSGGRETSWADPSAIGVEELGNPLNDLQEKRWISLMFAINARVERKTYTGVGTPRGAIGELLLGMSH